MISERLWTISFKIFIVLYAACVNNGYHNSFSPYLPVGNVSGTRCTAEGVRNANDYQLNSILNELANTKYFRLARVNIAQLPQSTCEYIMSGSNTTIHSKPAFQPHINETDTATEPETCSGIGNDWMQPFTQIRSKSETSTASESSCSIIPDKVLINDRKVEFSISKDEEDVKKDFFNDTCKEAEDNPNSPPYLNRKENSISFWHDLCMDSNNPNPDNADQNSVSNYVNLVLNPERNTGYNGSSIWNAIYAQNCLSSDGLMKQYPDSSNERCYEERVLHRLLSGWHASVSIHIAAEYYFNKNKWQPNIDHFLTSVGNHTDRLENLHFAFVVVLRALFRARDLLHLSAWEYNTGNDDDDKVTQSLMRRLLESSAMSLCSPLVFGFDETTLFSTATTQSTNMTTPVNINNIYILDDKKALASKFKNVFQDITKLVSCVRCQKCRLHGKVAIHGIGAALKILLTPKGIHPRVPNLYDEDVQRHSLLTRDDVVALVNVLHKFSNALSLSKELFSALHKNDKDQESINQKVIGTPPRVATAHMNINNVNSFTAKPPSPVDNLDWKQVAMNFVSIAVKSGWITKPQEDALMTTILEAYQSETSSKAKVMRDLTIHFSNDITSFIRHSLRWILLHKEPPLSNEIDQLHLNSSYDVIVVGGGMAGMVTAITAADRGAKVLLLDKMPRLGGNSAKASSGINSGISKYDMDGYDFDQQFFNDTVKSADDAGNIELAKVLVNRSIESIEWLKSRIKVDLSLVGQLGGNSNPRTLRPRDGLVGSELVAALQGIISNELSHKITVMNNMKVIELLTAEGTNHTSHVVGVKYIQNTPHPDIKTAEAISNQAQEVKNQRSFLSVMDVKQGFLSMSPSVDENNLDSCHSEHNQCSLNFETTFEKNDTTAFNALPLPVNVFADAVVLASGGFGYHPNTVGDDEKMQKESLLQQFRPDLLSTPTTLGKHTTGDGIKLALSVGADLIDMEYVQLHPTGFVDPKAPNESTKVLAAEILRGVGGILLDPAGGRFCNELGTRSYVVEKMRENGSKFFWILLNQSMASTAERHVKAYVGKNLLLKLSYSDMVALIANTHDNYDHFLNYANGMDHSPLQCVDDKKCQKIVRNLQEYFAISSLNGSNGSMEVMKQDNQSWYVGQVVPVVHYTMGGIKVDPHGRVLQKDSEDQIIQGLYAVGEVSGGVHGKNRLGGNSLLECTVFGRIVGMDVKSSSELRINNQVIRLNDDHMTMETSSVVKSQTKIPTLSVEEVSHHSQEHDCWVILHNEVFDLSQYAAEHPGGADSILRVCGNDGTHEFDAIHSKSLLKNSGFTPIGVVA